MLSIPEPCNEDFSKMTPTQRGAFCSKCQIDTFDFRDLSGQDINKILLENKGNHLCGQFKNSQLEELNAGFMYWKNQKSATFRSKFVFALVLVFGLSLFSCESEEEKEALTQYAIQMSVTPLEKPLYVNEVDDAESFDLIDHIAPIPGIIAMEEVVICEIPEEKEGFIDSRYDEYVTAGVPMSMPLGGAMVQVDYITYLEDTMAIVEEESILPEINNSNPDFFEITSYPNPTNDNATLAIEVKDEGQFDIKLYDMNGSLIRDMYTGELTAGRQTFLIDLNAEQSGMYIINVISRDQNETLKVQKLN